MADLLHQVIARDKEDLDARWDRAVLYAEINEPRKALDAFETIAAARPGDSEVGTSLPLLACMTPVAVAQIDRLSTMPYQS
jgi:hypothetical protein